MTTVSVHDAVPGFELPEPHEGSAHLWDYKDGPALILLGCER